MSAYIADEEHRLIAAAKVLEERGYPKAGDFLRERPLQLHTTRAVAHDRQTFRIRDAHEIPSGLALWFAGDANRWPELLEANPALRVQKGAASVDQIVRPRRKGLLIVLPSGWRSDRQQPAP